MTRQRMIPVLVCIGLVAGVLWSPARAEEPAPKKEKTTVAQIGQPAPALRLNDQDGKARALFQDGGEGTWVALAFYPKALTPG